MPSIENRGSIDIIQEWDDYGTMSVNYIASRSFQNDRFPNDD